MAGRARNRAQTMNENLMYSISDPTRRLLIAQMSTFNQLYLLFHLLLSGSAVDEPDEDQDSIKETLLETNPYLLGLTVAISILHSVFELLAFKNDIQFWNNRKSLEGLSVRSVFFGVFQSLIVLLYVLDNETNFMIRVSCFIGLGIEIWKIQKVVDFKLNKEDRLFGIFPRLTFTDKGSYVDSSTKQYDNLAFKYLGWLCFPLLIGFGVYSIIYNEHKGWYSFVLNMLYGFLLTFGFIMMTPQLFINYKLKSVAHLPWRMMTYKFLNTFIDDIFAFVIKMPTMYRLGCFRDGMQFIYAHKHDRHLITIWFSLKFQILSSSFSCTKDGSTKWTSHVLTNSVSLPKWKRMPRRKLYWAGPVQRQRRHQMQTMRIRQQYNQHQQLNQKLTKRKTKKTK